MNFFVSCIIVFMIFTMADQFIKMQKKVVKNTSPNMNIPSDPLINKHPYSAD